MEFYSLAYGKETGIWSHSLLMSIPCDQDYQLSSHEGEEFLYVLQGKIEVLYGQEKYELEASR